MPDDPTPGTPSQESTPQSDTSQSSPPAENSVAEALNAFETELSGVPSTTIPEASPESEEAAAVVRPSRSFDGLDEAETEDFRRMSNSAYDRLYPIYKEHKTLKPAHEKLLKEHSELQGRTFYDEPHAYMLSQDYVQAVNTSNQL